MLKIKQFHTLGARQPNQMPAGLALQLTVPCSALLLSIQKFVAKKMFFFFQVYCDTTVHEPSVHLSLTLQCTRYFAKRRCDTQVYCDTTVLKPSAHLSLFKTLLSLLCSMKTLKRKQNHKEKVEQHMAKCRVECRPEHNITLKVLT